MEANQTKLQNILEGTRQYIIPLFQRPYSWEQKHWQDLWDDVTELLDEPNRSHFMGAIVTMPTKSVPEGVQKFLLIDGQQRLTTISILLALLRDRLKGGPNARLSDEIQETLLVNRFKDGNDFFKLMPTQGDRDDYARLIAHGEKGSDSQITKCYKFFEKKMNTRAEIDLAQLKNIILRELFLVSITLDAKDNPYAIFETLNSRGRILTQADLIRNYFLMRIHLERQESSYLTHWKPMQDLLGDGLTEFIRHYLVREGEFIRESEVFLTVKQKNESKSEDQVVQFLAELNQFSKYYSRIIRPTLEPDATIQKALSRIARFDVTTAYPFFLNAYHDYASRGMTAAEFAEIISITENFIFRRFICSVPTNGLNKIFPSLYYQAKSEGNLLSGIKAILAAKLYPKDDEFKERLMNTKLYFAGEKLDRARFLLECLEESFEHRENPSFENLTIEHVMPQKLTNWWKSHLGEEWESVYESSLHTLGNLTLSAYNSELSNADFNNKKEILMNSHLELNGQFKTTTKWDEDAIRARAATLADIALTLWPNFSPSTKPSTQATSREAVARQPKTLFILETRYPVSTWRDVEQKTLEVILDLDADKVKAITDEFPKFIGPDPSKFKSNRKIADGIFIETHLSAQRINRFCIHACQIAGLSPTDWRIEFTEQ